MCKYFFHVRDGSDLIEDLEGLELAGSDSALSECRRIIQGVLGEEEWQDELDARREFQVVDELGRIVLVVPFKELENEAGRVNRSAGRRA